MLQLTSLTPARPPLAPPRLPPSVWAARLSPIMKYSQVTAFLRNDGDQSIAFQPVIFSPFTAPLAMLTVISAGGRLDRTTNAALFHRQELTFSLSRPLSSSPSSSLPLPSSPSYLPEYSLLISLSLAPSFLHSPLSPPYLFCTSTITPSLSMILISLHLFKNLFEIRLAEGAGEC